MAPTEGRVVKPELNGSGVATTVPLTMQSLHYDNHNGIRVSDRSTNLSCLIQRLDCCNTVSGGVWL